mgnify:CR=1 FL=1
MRYVFAVLFVSLSAMSSVMGGTVGAREGWVVIDTTYPFSELTGRLETAVKDQRMGLVTSASASDGAKAAGFQIPGNKVYGVFRNDFARRMLAANVAAGIEAPIRFYVTENADGTATLSYKKPTAVFAPYAQQASELKGIAAALDAISGTIAESATHRN